MNKKRTFIIGDEWIYFKIYTGYKTADILLINTIFPLTVSFLKEGLIDNWFFIRYFDSHFHLRIRFHIPKNENIASIIFYFNNAMQYYVNQEIVWKIQTDTYQREMERYSIDLIELSEKLFYFDSEMICKTIALDSVKRNENLRWLSGIKMIDTLLSDFGYSQQDKWKLLNSLQDSFGKEFGITTNFRRQFGQKYRKEKALIEKVLNKNYEFDVEYTSLFKPIFEKSEVSKLIVKEIKSKIVSIESHNLNDLLSCYIHMMMNRLFRIQQRTHELVLYDYLFRYYNSLQARQK